MENTNRNSVVDLLGRAANWIGYVVCGLFVLKQIVNFQNMGEVGPAPVSDGDSQSEPPPQPPIPASESMPAVTSVLQAPVLFPSEEVYPLKEMGIGVHMIVEEREYSSELVDVSRYAS